MPEISKLGSVVKLNAIQLATKAHSPAETRAQLQKAIADLKDSDLHFVRGIHILLLA